MLNAKHIEYQAYELPVRKLSAVETAELLQVPVSEVCKTIVAVRQQAGKPILVVIPGDKEVNTKSLAKEIGEKKVSITTQKDAEKITGLKAGGISPLALINRGFQVLIDTQAQNINKVYISGGQLGISIRLSPQDLAAMTNACFVSVC